MNYSDIKDLPINITRLPKDGKSYNFKVSINQDAAESWAYVILPFLNDFIGMVEEQGTVSKDRELTLARFRSKEVEIHLLVLRVLRYCRKFHKQVGDVANQVG